MRSSGNQVTIPEAKILETHWQNKQLLVKLCVDMCNFRELFVGYFIEWKTTKIKTINKQGTEKGSKGSGREKEKGRQTVERQKNIQHSTFLSRKENDRRSIKINHKCIKTLRERRGKNWKLSKPAIVRTIFQFSGFVRSFYFRILLWVNKRFA